MKKILMICVNSQSVINFRRNLILDYESKGYSISIISFDDLYKNEISELGVKFYSIGGSNRNLNILKNLTLVSKYRKIIRKEKPDVVFNFMLKPNIFGTIASKKEKIKRIYCMVEGVGDVFIKQGLKWKVIRTIVTMLYENSLKYANKVFFLNQDDLKLFCDKKLVKINQTVLIHGIGVDLDKFKYEENIIKKDLTFIMVSRMLKSKGVIEYCKAAEIVKTVYPNVTFKYVGSEGDITLNDIKYYIENNIIEYCGFKKDIKPLLKKSNIFVLPSYREGLPVSIMEAEAMGKPVITTNNVGCKDSIKDGYNGFLVDCNYKKIAEKMIYMQEHLDFVRILSVNSRKFAEYYFDVEKIDKIILNETTDLYEKEGDSD